MSKRTIILAVLIVFLLILSLGLSACKPQPPVTEIPLPQETTQVPELVISIPTATAEPTATQIPAAALVNGEPIPLTYYQNEVLRYKDGWDPKQPLPDEPVLQTNVLTFLIDQQLLAQAAYKDGFNFSGADLQAKIDNLTQQLPEGSSLTAWQQANHFDDAEFRMALTLAAAAAYQRDVIISAVPEAMEQVRARQIFARTEDGAKRALADLNAGKAFEEIAWIYSPETGGELGWFPRGYLLFPQVEEVAFTLKEGEVSQIVQSDIGYHIILVMAHEASHPLTTDARLALQRTALDQWLENTRASSEIMITQP